MPSPPDYFFRDITSNPFAVTVPFFWVTLKTDQPCTFARRLTRGEAGGGLSSFLVSDELPFEASLGTTVVSESTQPFQSWIEHWPRVRQPGSDLPVPPPGTLEWPVVSSQPDPCLREPACVGCTRDSPHRLSRPRARGRLCSQLGRGDPGSVSCDELAGRSWGRGRDSAFWDGYEGSGSQCAEGTEKPQRRRQKPGGPVETEPEDRRPASTGSR